METGGGKKGLTFTKSKEDRWTVKGAVPPEPIMFKEKKYPSASAALEAYIQQHEGRPELSRFLPKVCLLKTTEHIDELLNTHTGPDLHAYSKPDQFVNSIQPGRYQALKTMVDDAYARIEFQARARMQVDNKKQDLSGYQDLINKTLTESQRVLTCISPLPGDSPATSCIEGPVAFTDITNADHGLKPKQSAVSLKTIQDYVNAAKLEATNVDAESEFGALSRLQALLHPSNSKSHQFVPAVSNYKPYTSMGVVGSTAQPTVPATNHSISMPNMGGRFPPDWVFGLGTPHVGRSDTAATNHVSKQELDKQYQTPLKGHRGQTLSDLVSLTTDDLVYATPDGRSLSALQIKSSFSAQSQKNRTVHSQVDKVENTNETEGADRLLSAMRRDFASRLAQEVDDGPSSIVMAHGLHPYQSPVIMRRVEPHTPQVPVSPTKLRTLGLLTPDTEQLLAHPPRPGPMPGYNPMLSTSLEELYTYKGDDDVATPQTNMNYVLPSSPNGCHQLSADFSDRVRALLLATPGGELSNITRLNATGHTSDILEGDREWERQPSFKPPKQIEEDASYMPQGDASAYNKANIVEAFLKDCLSETNKEDLTLSGRGQPGTMEALKNMLFKVQSMVAPHNDSAVHTINTSGDHANVTDTTVTQDQKPWKEHSPVAPAQSTQQQSISAYQHLIVNNETFEEQHGTESLQRAMEHLGRLKTLVKDRELDRQHSCGKTKMALTNLDESFETTVSELQRSPDSQP